MAEEKNDDFTQAIKQVVRDTMKEVLEEQKKNNAVTKEDIMKIKDRKTRQQMIEDHIDLFK